MVLSEDILKIKYRKEAFDVFEIEKGTLLTPSAKQFLNEKKHFRKISPNFIGSIIFSS